MTRAGLTSRTLPAGERQRGPMPWVIAIMIALAVVAGAGALALDHVASAARRELGTGLTVQIVAALPAEREREVAQVLTVLQHDPAVAKTRPVPQHELEQLLEPWLGTQLGDRDDTLPIPALIDVALAPTATHHDLARLGATIKAAAATARVDSPAQWLASLVGALAALEWLAGGTIGLFALAAAAVVLLATRHALASARDTIAVVHMLGGTDRQIARLFQGALARDAALGGGVGWLCGIAAVLALGRALVPLGNGLGAIPPFDWRDWALLGALPVGGIVLAGSTARIGVLLALRRWS